MLLGGFEHNKATKEKKALAIKNGGLKAPSNVDAVSRGGKSKSSRRSKSRTSRSKSHYEDQEEDEEDDSSYDGIEPGFEVPQNKEIEINEDEKNLLGLQQVIEKKKPLQPLPPGVPVEALNPRNYAFVPSQWTERIRHAGRPVNHSESVGNVIYQRVAMNTKDKAAVEGAS